MAYISYNKLRQSEFYNNVSARNKTQDINLYQLKLKAKATYKTDEKITTKFEASNPEVVINKDFLDTKLAEVKEHNSLSKKIIIKFRNHEMYNEEVLFQEAVKNDCSFTL